MVGLGAQQTAQHPAGQRAMQSVANMLHTRMQASDMIPHPAYNKEATHDLSARCSIEGADRSLPESTSACRVWVHILPSRQPTAECKPRGSGDCIWAHCNDGVLPPHRDSRSCTKDICESVERSPGTARVKLVRRLVLPQGRSCCNMQYGRSCRLNTLSTGGHSVSGTR